MPYGIRAIPAHAGAGAPEFYEGGAADGSRAGYFYANVLALKRRPKWEMEALFLHEAVPGHHLQAARALELNCGHPAPGYRCHPPSGSSAALGRPGVG
jgi:uncharacterized protein (DUF885 family)